MHSTYNLIVFLMLLLLAREELFLCYVIRFQRSMIVSAISSLVQLSVVIISSSLLRSGNSLDPAIAWGNGGTTWVVTTVDKELALSARSPDNDFRTRVVSSLLNDFLNDGTQWRTHRLLVIAASILIIFIWGSRCGGLLTRVVIRSRD